MKTLTIKLAAPLQSFGKEASFNIRTSYPHPSKSAVIGMIAAALGYRRYETEKIKLLDNLKFAIRIEQTGSMMRDFQIVRYGPKPKEVKLTSRYYLQDAVFLVAIGSENERLIEDIQKALKKPKFQLFIGRRSNPPAGVLKTEIYNDSPVEVLEKADWKASNWFKKKLRKDTIKTEIYADADLLPEARNQLVKDAFGSFDQKNRYHNFRAVASEIVDIKNKAADKEKDSNYDIWRFV